MHFDLQTISLTVLLAPSFFITQMLHARMFQVHVVAVVHFVHNCHIPECNLLLFTSVCTQPTTCSVLLQYKEINHTIPPLNTIVYNKVKNLPSAQTHHSHGYFLVLGSPIQYSGSIVNM